MCSEYSLNHQVWIFVGVISQYLTVFVLLVVDDIPGDTEMFVITSQDCIRYMNRLDANLSIWPGSTGEAKLALSLLTRWP
jgi:hypothetical protein